MSLEVLEKVARGHKCGVHTTLPNALRVAVYVQDKNLIDCMATVGILHIKI